MSFSEFVGEEEFEEAEAEPALGESTTRDVLIRLMATPFTIVLDILTSPIQAFFSDPVDFVSDWADDDDDDRRRARRRVPTGC